MKLSEAIRLGSMLRPQAFGKIFDGKSSCAFGAAQEALGLHWDFPVVITWPWLDDPLICPACLLTEQLGAAVISSHLNDKHQWTREEIADWVATVEPQKINPVVVSDSQQSLLVAQRLRAPDSSLP